MIALREERPERDDVPPSDASETLRELTSLAGTKTAGIPASYLAAHVEDVAKPGGWPVARAAMEAVLRRIAARDQDELRVATRPAGSPFGVYTTRRTRRDDRPYATWLGSLRPLRASCGCRDFLRNSLGLCKHVIAVLRDLAARRRFERALDAPLVPFAPGSHLSWDPIRPLTGRGDWFDRVALVGGRRIEWPGKAAGDDAPRRAAIVRRLAAHVAAGTLVAEPAVAALLSGERIASADGSTPSLRAEAIEKALRSLRQPLYPYQREGVAKFLGAGALLLADDMGLGKTAQAIASCHVLWTTRRVRRGLLVVPASLKSQWLREWRLFTDAPIAVVEGGPAQRAAAYRETREGFLVANYEQVLRDLEAMHAWAPQLVVLDEAQRIKNWATKTAAYVKRLSPPWRLVLTGTPMENRLEELGSLMDWVDDHALEPKWRLAPWHTVHADGTAAAQGARNLDTLRTRLEPSMLRRNRREVLTQLPSRTDTVVPVELTPEQRQEHDELSLPIARLVAIAHRRPITQAEFLRLMSLLTTQRIISNGIAQLRFQEVWESMCASRCPDPALLDALGSPKLRELREIVSQVAVAQGRKIVVFSQWRRMLRLAEWAVSDLLVTQGLRAAFFTGAEAPKRRTQNVVDFHDDPSMRVLFLTDAGGVGLNLQRAASCCVNVELPWNPAVLEQRIGRIHRMGQRDPIDVYNLVGQDSIESRIASLVEEKKAFFTGLFDGASDEVRFEQSGSFLARMERLVEPVVAPVLDAAPPAAAEDDAAITAAAETAAESTEPDSASERAIDAVVEAADESRDAPAPSADASTGGPGPDSSRLPADAADPTSPAVARDATRVPSRGSDVVRQLFSGLVVRATSDGGLRIDAPPEDAARLASVFEGLAGMLRAAAAENAGRGAG